MDARQILPFILLITTTLPTGCSSDAPRSNARQEAPAAPVSPAEITSQAPQDQPDTPAAKPSAQPAEQKADDKKAPATTATKKDPVPPPSSSKQSAPVGPTGYISRLNVLMQSEPKAGAAQTGSFKRYEQVKILETKMTDDAGNLSDVPQWYKVQRADKQVGWVVARSVSMN